MKTPEALQALETLLLVTGSLFLVGSLDDFFIDLAHLLLGLKPKNASEQEVEGWFARTEKPIAIMIPAWREHSVLRAMLHTNLARLRYHNYRFFVGVYPNDEETLSIARELEAKYPNLLTVIVTDRPGPTSKAHCLNCILRVIQGAVAIARTEGRGWIPHFVAIHDAEDVIHPLALQAINAQDEKLDFIQVPIFSLPVPVKDWVAGTYLDEFAEIHMKEIPVREALGMPVPSAGVGTFLNWTFVERMIDRFGECFDEKMLTEDYEVAYRMKRLGASQRFLLVRDPAGEIIATREYFPDSLGRSIRQKTRWTTGIALQTWKKWGWFGVKLPRLADLPFAYALWRDRKSLWSNPLSVFSWILLPFGAAAIVMAKRGALPPLAHAQVLNVLLAANAALLVVRVFQRVRFTAKVYGRTHAIAAVPRIVPSTVINAAASFRASRDFARAQKPRAGQKKPELVWDKTDHKFPTIEIPELNGKENRV